MVRENDSIIHAYLKKDNYLDFFEYIGDYYFQNTYFKSIIFRHYRLYLVLLQRKFLI